jgi:hypothetical protein
MVLWSELDVNFIESVPWGKDRHKFTYQGSPLRFQIPKGICQGGISAFKSIQVGVTNQEFMNWWRELETLLCPQEPFKSNLSGEQIRIKIDDAIYIFDENSKQISPDLKEGLFKGVELACLVDVHSTYYFNGTWGLTVRLAQVKFWGDLVAKDADAVLAKGVCAFLQTDDSS